MLTFTAKGGFAALQQECCFYPAAGSGFVCRMSSYLFKWHLSAVSTAGNRRRIQETEVCAARRRRP